MFPIVAWFPKGVSTNTFLSQRYVKDKFLMTSHYGKYLIKRRANLVSWTSFSLIHIMEKQWNVKNDAMHVVLTDPEVWNKCKSSSSGYHNHNLVSPGHLGAVCHILQELQLGQLPASGISMDHKKWQRGWKWNSQRMPTKEEKQPPCRKYNPQSLWLNQRCRASSPPSCDRTTTTCKSFYSQSHQFYLHRYLIFITMAIFVHLWISMPL